MSSQNKKLELLIITMPRRHLFLDQLVPLLESQCHGKDAGFTIAYHDPDVPIGDAKQQMKEKSTGEYICFFDDDDLPASDYVDRILPLLDGTDYIGFRVQCYQGFQPLLKTYHSLRYKGWSDDGEGYYREISHINPMRRELSLAVPIEGHLTQDSGEDYRWAMKMSEAGIVKTEHYIRDVMYHYYPRASSNDEADAKDPRRLRILGMPVDDRSPIAKALGLDCQNCGSGAIGMAGGMRRCNQCGVSF